MSYVPPPGMPPGAVYVSAPPPERSNNTALIVAVAVVAVVAIIAAAFVFLRDDGSDSELDAVAVTEPSGPGEVFLAPAAEPGPDPFSESTAAALPGAIIDLAKAVQLGDSGAQAPALGVANPNGAASFRGGTPGLYGGTRDSKSCDAEKMISFLSANPSKAAAWGSVHGVSAADVPAYIRGLTPVLLRGDTRVTNHGYRNGRATALQAVLQAGTAVLVDQYGMPRAKCNCGNPLSAPIPTAVAPTYTGAPWPGFVPTGVTVVVENTTVIEIITLIDVVTGTPYGRPTGPNPGPDTGLPPVTTAPAVTLPPPPGTGAPGTTLPTQQPTNPPATQPPGTQPPATQPPPTADTRPFRLVSATHEISELANLWTVDDRAGTASIAIAGGIGAYSWTVPETIEVGGTAIDWGGTVSPPEANINLTIEPSATGATITPGGDLLVQGKAGRKSATLTPTADAQEIIFRVGMGFAVSTTYVYRR